VSRYTRRAGKRDTIEPDVIKIAKSWGWLVKQFDLWDLQCYHPGADIQLSVEVKTGDATLTDSQADLIREGWPLYVIRSIHEAEILFSEP